MTVTPPPSFAPDPGFRPVLRGALGQVRQATGLPVLFAGTVLPGSRNVRLTEFAGTSSGALRNLLIRTGHGLGGRVLQTAKPCRVHDYITDTRISHEYDRPVGVEGLRAIAAVPLMAGKSLSGLLYAGIREPLPLGNRVLDAMTHVAARLEAELRMRAELARRTTELETAAITRAAREAPTAPELEHLREAHAELRLIAQEITDPALRQRLQNLCDRLASPPRDRPTPANPLSPRELDVLSLVAVGCGNAEVGRRLGLKPETVKSYLRGAMRKLDAHTRMEAVVAARRAGFLP
ncbi:LuxR C-terminal-related transcriptional regulator [Thermopolyspora sp. NPDC052614]|uniref:LuxR C-terminal-related transcriptional regulator n=1 Tax=Thermopolyspora sp. NPDC052614 TaxID=3155682 RepID=UPI003416F25A